MLQLKKKKLEGLWHSEPLSSQSYLVVNSHRIAGRNNRSDKSYCSLDIYLMCQTLQMHYLESFHIPESSLYGKWTLRIVIWWVMDSEL